MKTSDDLFLHFLQDVYYAERQILKALPKMTKAAQSPKLKEAFVTHHEETQHQVERLQQVFESIRKRAKGVTCEAIQGLIEEGEEVVNEFEQGAIRDAGLAACAQAIEHYEMARYGALIAWAKAAGNSNAVTLLEQTLAEEKKTDGLLNQIANDEINPAAVTKKAA